MSTLASWLRALLAALVVFAVVPASSQAQEDPLDAAARLFREGAEAYANEDFATAADRFAEAYAYDPNDRLAFNAGRSYELAGNLESALEWFRRVLETTADADLITLGQEAVARVESQLSSDEPPPDDEPPALTMGAVFVSVDVGGVIARASVDGGNPLLVPVQVDVEPGAHEVTIFAEGYETFNRTVVVAAGETRFVDASLTALETGPSGGRVASYVIGSAGLAMTASGAIFYLVAKGHHDEMTAAQDEETFVDEQAAGRSSAALSTTFYALGGIALITGIVMYAVTGEGHPEEVDERESGVRWLISPTAVGVDVRF